MKNRKGFTLIELMVVILIVAILAAVAIPILRGRIDAAKWSEGRAVMGTIGTAIRAYHAENGVGGVVPTAIIGSGVTELGFIVTDLTGTYFASSDFAMSALAMDPLAFTIRCTAGGDADAPANPLWYELNQAGEWAVP